MAAKSPLEGTFSKTWKRGQFATLFTYLTIKMTTTKEGECADSKKRKKHGLTNTSSTLETKIIIYMEIL